MLRIFLTLLCTFVITHSTVSMEKNSSENPQRIVSEGPLQRLRPATLREEKIVVAYAKAFIAVAKNSTDASEYLINFAGVNKFVRKTIKDNRQELKNSAQYAQDHIYEKFANDSQLLSGDFTNPIIKKTAKKIVQEQYNTLDARALFFLPPDDMLNRTRLKKIQHLFDNNPTAQVTPDNINDLLNTLDWSANASHKSTLSYTLLGALRTHARQYASSKEMRARFVDIVKTSLKDPDNGYITESLFQVGQELYGDELYTAQGQRSPATIVDTYLELHKSTRTKAIVTTAINSAYNC